MANQNRQVDTHTLDTTNKAHPAKQNEHSTRVMIRASKNTNRTRNTHGY